MVSQQRILSATLIILTHPLWIESATGQSDKSSKLGEIMDEMWTERLESSPLHASQLGERTYDHLLADPGIEAAQKRDERRTAFINSLKKLKQDDLSRREKETLSLLLYELKDQKRAFQFHPEEMPLTQQQGIQLWLPELPDRLPIKTRRHRENYIARLNAVPEYINKLTSALEKGIETGRTAPRLVMERVPDQLDATASDRFLHDPDSHPNFVPFLELDEDDPQVQDARDVIVNRVVPAMKNLQDFLRMRYVPHCRDSISASDLPDGKSFYESRLRHFTTLELTPQYIRNVGSLEVAGIREQMMAVIARTDYPNAEGLEGDDLLRGFTEWLRTEPRFFFTEETDLITHYRSLCKRVDALLPPLFRLMPKLPYGVKALPGFMGASAPSGYYYPGSLKNGLPGYFMVNTHRLNMRPRYEMIPLALHEAVPGHHLQIAIAQERDGVHPLERDLQYDAFSEGWALYAERLGLEMGDGDRGLYSDPYDDFGRLSFEMWRALRLVVDTGIHASGWDRKKAIDYMLANSALSRVNVESEVDRYIAWPGQATAYKIGEIRIRMLRAHAEASLGQLFDIRSFHRAVLAGGSIPLPVLEERVNRWIEKTYEGE